MTMPFYHCVMSGCGYSSVLVLILTDINLLTHTASLRTKTFLPSFTANQSVSLYLVFLSKTQQRIALFSKLRMGHLTTAI